MKSQYILPISIVVVGVLVAGAIFLLSRGSGANLGGSAVIQAVNTSTDHIFGNPDAPVKIVEYSDLECPYCKDFQATMEQIMDYYGKSGKVAWVFRNFPLGQIHSKAPKEAEATECAAAQGGNDAFFNYVKKVYQITPSNNNLDLTQLPVIAGQIGLNVDAFNQCLNSGTYTSKVQSSYDQAISEGIQGTPHTVIMARGENVLSLDGNQPYASMRAAIDEVLTAIGESVSTSTATTTR